MFNQGVLMLTTNFFWMGEAQVCQKANGCAFNMSIYMQDDSGTAKETRMRN